MLKLLPSPIGNLDDISYRTIKALAEAEVFYCEDTRITKKLIKLLQERHSFSLSCDTFLSLHSHNESDLLNDTLLDQLRNQNVVFISDAGMPCISDPGAKLVDFCIQNHIAYDVLPGANALITAFAMSGFDVKEFSFFGFLDHKGQSRAQKLHLAMNNEFVSIVYESPHRLHKLIDEIVAIDPSRIIFIVKEISKLHQKSFKQTAIQIQSFLGTINTNGEWVIIISPCKKQETNPDEILSLDLSLKEKAKLYALAKGISNKEAYNILLNKDHP